VIRLELLRRELARLGQHGIARAVLARQVLRYGDDGIDNTYRTTKTLREGPWYNSDPRDPRSSVSSGRLPRS